MAVAFQSDGAVVWAAEANNNAVTVPLPATRPVGSVLLFVAWCRLITAAAPAPSGYTLLATWTSATASGGRMWMYAKEVVGGETAPSITPVGTTGTSGDAWGASIYCYSGVDLNGGISAILDGTPTTTDAAGTTTCTYPALTISGTTSMLLRFLCRFRDAADTFTPTATWTEQEDASTTNRTGAQHHWQDKLAVASGSQASVTVAPSNTTSSRYLAVTAALKAAPAATATSVARISLASGSTPATRTLHTIKVRARISSGFGASLKVALYEGATNRSGDLDTGTLTTSLADYTLAIPDASAANITDYSNLELRIWGVDPSGVSVFEVANVQLQMPAAAAGGTVTFDCTVTDAAVVAVQADRTRAVDATLTRTSAVAVQADRTRAVDVTISDAAVVVVQAEPTRNVATTVVGAAAVSPSLTVTSLSLVSFDATISRAASVVAQEDPTRSIAATVVGVSAVTAQEDPFRNVAATITRTSAVTAQADRLRAVDMAIGRAGAVSIGLTVTPAVQFAATIAPTAAVSPSLTVTPSTQFVIAIAGNQPYAGEHTVGEFLVGDEDVLSVTLSVGHDATLDGLIAGQAQVAASMTITRSLSVDVVGAGSLTAQQAITTGLAATVSGLGAVVAQANETRALAITISRQAAVAVDLTASPPIALAASVQGQAVVAVDIVRVPVTVAFSATVAGQAVVTPAMTVTNASFVNMDAAVVGAASVSAQTVNTVSFGCTVARAASVSADLKTAITFAVSVARTSTVTTDLTTTAATFTAFIASVQGQAAVATDIGRLPLTVTFSSSVAGAAQVSPALTVSRIVSFSCTIARVNPLVGTFLVGTLLVGGSTGPLSQVNAGMVLTTDVADAQIQGKTTVTVGLTKTVSLGVSIAGQAQVLSVLGQTRFLAVSVAGKTAISAVLTMDWLGPTSPGNITLPPTTEGSWILVQTTPGTGTLVATTPRTKDPTPTVETALTLVPTTEKTM